MNKLAKGLYIVDDAIRFNGQYLFRISFDKNNDVYFIHSYNRPIVTAYVEDHAVLVNKRFENWFQALKYCIVFINQHIITIML